MHICTHMFKKIQRSLFRVLHLKAKKTELLQDHFVVLCSSVKIFLFRNCIMLFMQIQSLKLIQNICSRPPKVLKKSSFNQKSIIQFLVAKPIDYFPCTEHKVRINNTNKEKKFSSRIFVFCIFLWVPLEPRRLGVGLLYLRKIFTYLLQCFVSIYKLIIDHYSCYLFVRYFNVHSYVYHVRHQISKITFM